MVNRHLHEICGDMDLLALVERQPFRCVERIFKCR
jgi:hypothetical protein